MLNESGSIGLRPAPPVWHVAAPDVDLVDVFEDALHHSLPVLEPGGGRVNVRLPRERLMIRASYEPLCDLLSRLLQLLARPPHRELWTRLAREGTHVTLRLGTTPAAGSALHETPSGSDLPMMVRNLLTRLPDASPHARFRIQASDAADVGVVMLFPVHERSAPATTDRPSRVLRILVVDDNADTVDTLVTLLELRGHATRAAYDGQMALEMALSFRPDVVLLDLALPGLCGYDIARKLRQQPASADCRLVAITGLGTDADRAATAAAGFEHHFVKPFDVNQLLDVLEGRRSA